MDFRATLERLVTAQDLDHESATALMAHLVDGQATELEIGAALTAIRAKGATAVELAAFAAVIRARADSVQSGFANLVDTCGTGGGYSTFNISTTAAIIASAAGAKVAKHGNRAVTSQCGSADVLEALGVRLGSEPESVLHQLEAIGIAFFFAPNHHPTLRNVAAARKALGIRTVFNQLGPLANPAGAKRQLIGVYDRRLTHRMAEALRLLKTERGLVVHGADGLDEISPCAGTFVTKLWDGHVTELEFSPRDFDIPNLNLDDLKTGATAQENAKMLEEAITSVNSVYSHAAIPSAAAALWLAGVAENVGDGAAQAREAVQSGLAAAKLKALVEFGGQ